MDLQDLITVILVAEIFCSVWFYDETSAQVGNSGAGFDSATNITNSTTLITDQSYTLDKELQLFQLLEHLNLEIEVLV